MLTVSRTGKYTAQIFIPTFYISSSQVSVSIYNMELHHYLCDRVPGGVVRVQRTRACNGHWRWVATLLSLRASTKQSMVFK